MSDQILTNGDVVSVFVYRLGKSRAECSCGWEGKNRLLRAAAIQDAQRHSVSRRCGQRCQLDYPLVCDVDKASLWRTLTPAPVVAFLPILILPAGLWAAPESHALSVRPTYTATVVWTGAPDCIQAWLPDGAGASAVALCSPDKMWTRTVPMPNGTSWIGVDPEMSGADTISCTLTASWGPLASDFGFRGDGDEVTCLKLWVA